MDTNVDRSRRRWIALVIALLTTVSVCGGLIEDGAAAPEAEGDKPSMTAELAGDLERERLQAEERWRTPEAQRAREASRTAFGGRGSRDARLTLDQQHPRLAKFRGWRPPQLREGERLAGYADDFSAFVEREGSRGRGLVTSAFPLRDEDGAGAKTPLDFELERDGDGFRPRNPLVDMRMPDRLANGIVLGDLRIKVADETGATADEVDGKAFWPNVARDTDFMVAPTPAGAETFHVVRSAAAPETFRLGFELPAGVRLRERVEEGPDGLGLQASHIEIARGTDVIAAVAPPVAWDADNRRVPLTATVNDGTIVLDVEHHGADVRYPLVVDPYIDYFYWWGNQGHDNLGWHWQSSHGGGRIGNYFVNSGATYYGDRWWGHYMYTFAKTDIYADNEWGNWRFNARGDAHIPRADFLAVNYQPSSGSSNGASYGPTSALDQGICRFNCSAWEDGGDGGSWWNPGDNVNAKYRGPARDYYGLWNHGKTHCAAYNCDWTKGTRSNSVIFRLVLPGYHYRPDQAIAYIGGAHVFQWDNVPPSVTGVSHAGLPTDWTNNGGQSITTTVSGQDGGLGMNQVAVDGPFGRRAAGWCGNDVDHNRFNGCPSTYSAGITYTPGDMGDGVHTLTASARDMTDNPSSPSAPWTVKLDRGSPNSGMSGPLTTRRAIGAGVHDLNVSGEDSKPVPRVSGARTTKLAVDGTTRATYSSASGCAEGCTTSGTFAFDAAAPLRWSDAFDSPAGTLVEAHPSPTATLWRRDAMGTAPGVITAEGNVRRQGAGRVRYFADVEQGADYIVRGKLNLKSQPTGESFWLLARYDPVTGNGYAGQLSGGVIRIVEMVNGLAYTLASYTSPFVAGNEYDVWFQVNGTRLTLGSEQFPGTGLAAIDTTFRQAGKAGFQLGTASTAAVSDSTGMHLDDFRIDGHVGERYDEGRRNLSASTTDGAANTHAAVTRDVIIDRTSPETPTAQGSLRQPSVGVGRHELQITARDRGTWPDIAGIDRIEVLVDDVIRHTDRVSAPSAEHATMFTLNTDDYEDGEHEIKVRAYDASKSPTDGDANPPSEETFKVEIRKGPYLKVTGPLREPGTPGRYADIHAKDPSAGMRRLEIWLDGVDTDPPDVTIPCLTNIENRCDYRYELPANTAEGQHHLRVRATDHDELYTEDEWTFNVVDTRVGNHDRLGLEQYFQYDETDAGGNSRVFVNADTGNVVWHAMPIVNPGRGLSTAVNLTYNAHDRGGMLGETLGRIPTLDANDAPTIVGQLAEMSYSEAGIGVSIGVSGPTRLNEPLGKVLEAQAYEENQDSGVPVPSNPPVITMTDADGTRHRFTRDGDRWKASDGMNLHLRRWRPGGSLLKPVDDKWAMTRPDGVTHFFDTLGYLRKTVDRNNNTLRYDYERVNAFDGKECSADAVIGKYVPPAAGTAVPVLCYQRVTKVVDPANRELVIHYRSGATLSDLLTHPSIGVPAGYPALLGGKAGRIERIVDHAGRTTALAYDTTGYLVGLREAQGTADERATKFVYEPGSTGLAGLGEDRQLLRVVELRDGDDENKTIEDSEEYADTELDYEIAVSSSVAGVAQAPRRAKSLTKRSDQTKTYDFGTEQTLNISEQLRTGRSATRTIKVDGDGRPVELTDPVGTVTKLGWNTDENKVASHTRAAGTGDEAHTVYGYDSANGTGVLTSKTEYPKWPDQAESRLTTFGYQFTAGRHQSNADGDAKTPSEDEKGTFVADLTSIAPAKANTGWAFTVDPLTGNVTHRTDAKQRTAITEYDTAGQITKETSEQPRMTPVQYFDYDATGQPQRVVDSRSKTWRYRYDAVGNLTKVIDPRGTVDKDAKGDPYVTILEYDALDRMVSEHIPKLSSANDFVTRTRKFDRNGNVTNAFDGLGKETIIGYTRMDRPEKVTQPGTNGNEITNYVYDDADRLIGEIAPKGAESDATKVTSGYTALCEAATGREALTYVTRHCLDDAGRRQATVRSSARPADAATRWLITTYAFDRRGNVVGIRDPERNDDMQVSAAITAVAEPTQRRTVREFNKVDELTADIERPDGDDAQKGDTEWRYSYDLNGNRQKVEHPTGSVTDGGAERNTEFKYDHRDELIAVINPENEWTCYQRREDGKVVGETSPRGVKAGDGTSPLGTKCLKGEPKVQYTHYTKEYTYDDAGDLESESVPFGPGQYNRSDTSFAGWELEYRVRDEVGNPRVIETPMNHTITASYYDTGELHKTDRPSRWRLSWPDEDHGIPTHGERFAGADDADLAIGTNGPSIEFRTERSANAERSDQVPSLPRGLGHGDFGEVNPESLPDMMPQAGSTTFSYDDEMRLTTILDARGFGRKIEYDDAGRVEAKSWPFKPDRPDTQAEDAQRIEHKFGYDAHGNLDSFTDGEGYEATYAFDGYDRVEEHTSPGARPDEAAEGEPASIAEVTRFTYDRNGNVLSRETPRGTASAGTTGDFTFQYAYDGLDRLAHEENPADDRWQYGYDAAGNLDLETTPNGLNAAAALLPQHQIKRTYDGADRLTSLTRKVQDGDAVKDLVTTYAYDEDGNRTETKEPGFKQQKGSDGTTPDPVAHVTKTVYDGRGLPWTHTVGDGTAARTTATEYDANATLRRTVNPAGIAADGSYPVYTGDTSFAGIEAATKNATLRLHDADDLLLSVRLPWDDADKERYKQTYTRIDALRRVQSITSPHVYSSDPAKDREAEAARTSYEYHDTDWIREISDSKLVKPSDKEPVESRFVSIDYDRRGNQNHWLTKNARESIAGTEVIRGFWPNGLLRFRTGKKTNAPDDESSRRRYDYFYNENRSLVLVDDRDVGRAGRVTEIDRDVAERPTDVDETWTGGRDTRFGNYDANGNVGIVRTDGDIGDTGFSGTDARSTTFTYDSIDREVKMVVDPAETGKPDRETTTTYHPSGDRFERTKSNDTVDRWWLNSRGEKSLHERVHGTTTATQSYTYDANGNRKTDERGTHDYNARDQLVKWTRPSDHAKKAGWSVGYTLNPDGAVRVKRERDGASVTKHVTTYNHIGERVVNSLDEDHTKSPVIKTRAKYTHDDFGNVVRIDHKVESGEKVVLPPVSDTDLTPGLCNETDASDDVTHYCYDEFERMRFSRGQGVKHPTVITYDGFDRRDFRTVTVNGEAKRRDYAYVGLSEQLSREVTPSGARQTFDYDSSGQRQGVKSPDGAYRPYHHDANGSIIGLEDATGNIAPNETYRYDPYGELENADGEPIDEGEREDQTAPITELTAAARENPFRFQGFYYDSGVKTYDMHARHYRPSMGQFLSQDRYESAAGDQALQSDPLTQNRYAFAGGNPVSTVEFDGHRPDFRGKNAGRNAKAWGKAQGRATTRKAITPQASGPVLPPRVTDTAAPRMQSRPDLGIVRPLAPMPAKGAICAGGRIDTDRCQRALRKMKGGNWGSLANMTVTLFSGAVGGVGKKAAKETGEEILETFADDVVEKAAPRLWRPNEVLGRRVYQRDDLIDPRRTGADGRTNLQRMQDGDAPIGPDGETINLHHTIQKEPGPMAEVAQTFHSSKRRTLHVNWPPRGFGSIHPSKSFEAWRKNYWRKRAGDFGP